MSLRFSLPDCVSEGEEQHTRLQMSLNPEGILKSTTMALDDTGVTSSFGRILHGIHHNLQQQRAREPQRRVRRFQPPQL